MDDYCKNRVADSQSVKNCRFCHKISSQRLVLFWQVHHFNSDYRQIIDYTSKFFNYLTVPFQPDACCFIIRRADHYYSMGKGAMDSEEKITIPKALLEVTRILYFKKEPLYLSIDEWGVFGENLRSVLANAACCKWKCNI